MAESNLTASVESMQLLPQPELATAVAAPTAAWQLQRWQVLAPLLVGLLVTASALLVSSSSSSSSGFGASFPPRLTKDGTVTLAQVADKKLKCYHTMPGNTVEEFSVPAKAFEGGNRPHCFYYKYKCTGKNDGCTAAQGKEGTVKALYAYTPTADICDHIKCQRIPRYRAVLQNPPLQRGRLKAGICRPVEVLPGHSRLQQHCASHCLC